MHLMKMQVFVLALFSLTMAKRVRNRINLENGGTIKRMKKAAGCALNKGKDDCLMMVRQTGLEPVTPGLEIRCSIQLSYWRTNHQKHNFGLYYIHFPVFLQPVESKSMLW